MSRTPHDPVDPLDPRNRAQHDPIDPITQRNRTTLDPHRTGSSGMPGWGWAAIAAVVLLLAVMFWPSDRVQQADTTTRPTVTTPATPPAASPTAPQTPPAASPTTPDTTPPAKQ